MDCAFGGDDAPDAGVVAPVEDVGEHATGSDLGGDTSVVIVAAMLSSTIPAGWLGSSVSGQSLSVSRRSLFLPL